MPVIITKATNTLAEDDRIKPLSFAYETEHARGYCRDMPRSLHGSERGSRNTRNNVTELREPNPWANEPGDLEDVPIVRPPRHAAPAVPRTRRSRSFDRAAIYGGSTRREFIRAQRSRSSSVGSPQSSDSSEGSLAISETSSSQVVTTEHRALVHEVRRLQKKLARLENRAAEPNDTDNTSKVPDKWTILHQVRCSDAAHRTSYLDEPKLIDDRDLSHLHWQGQRQVTNLRAWTRKQTAAFIVYREYHCGHRREEPHGPSEVLTVRSDNLDDFMSTWLRAGLGLTIYDQEGVYIDGEMKAPYVCFYHFQHEARQLLSGSVASFPDALPLLEYLDTAIAAVKKESENAFATGKVNAELMPYLFKPGGVVCFEESGNIVACEQASVLQMSHEDLTLHRKTYVCLTTQIAFDGTFRRLGSSRRHFSIQATADESVDIDKLSIQPLTHISNERRLDLKRRGEIFLKCQKHLYVTYPTGGGHHDFVC